MQELSKHRALVPATRWRSWSACLFPGSRVAASHYRPSLPTVQGSPISQCRVPVEEREETVADFRTTLDKFSVSAADQRECLAIVDRTKVDIVVGAKPSPK